MSSNTQKPVLILGGSGVVGSLAARTLRRLHPTLPIVIGGRDLARAEAVARELGHAEATRVDLERADLGQPASRAYGAIAMFVKDDSLRSLRYAQSQGAAYLGISTGLFEVAPEVAYFIHQPGRSAVLLDSSWLAGAATLATLHFAREFQSLETIEIAAVLDEQDLGGPAALADVTRQAAATQSTLLLEQGRWRWVDVASSSRTVRGVDGSEVQVQPYALLDPASLAAATDAKSIRFDLRVGMSAARRRGEPFSTEFIIELEGTRKDGTRGRVRHEVSHPAGQAPVTAMGVAVGLERLLGLVGGAPAAPGLYLPETLIEPEHLVRRLQDIGTRFHRA
ncbi:NAD(P)-dependent oxidoreductase [Myxococcus sp. K15C18031901]|uniref:NAD(P)-dependent oxidoreductase n=1 Tax=Myxococcus dinghuensis TaxID=2906761 RepID=UPI0020A72B6F|nr:NAD(P)-dependent oxidoreductase [Myxococcus dinghuensis]MCP3102595.1 NAD(P)-dependent oxidoreductase [Myxococcus dinghuensis]